jgi:hypothetical protein
MLEPTSLTIKRYYWPVAHALLQRVAAGQYDASAHGELMTLSNLKPELVVVLREALPAGAVLEAAQEAHAANLHSLFRL